MTDSEGALTMAMAYTEWLKANPGGNGTQYQEYLTGLAEQARMANTPSAPYEALTDSRALYFFRHHWDVKARQAEVYLSFRLEGKLPEEANQLTEKHFKEGNA